MFRRLFFLFLFVVGRGGKGFAHAVSGAGHGEPSSAKVVLPKRLQVGRAFTWVRRPRVRPLYSTGLQYYYNVTMILPLFGMHVEKPC